MTRRAVGLAVLVLALLAVVVAARVDGTRVAGTAIAPPGLSAPNVGECVASFADPARAVPAGDNPVAVTPSDEFSGPLPPIVGVVDETGVRFARCTGDHLGEVVAYRRMARQWTSDADRQSDIDWCRSVAADYRAHLQWRVSDAADSLWVPSTGQRFTVVLSAPFVDPGEPRWSACLVVPPHGESYRGSYVQSLAFGPAPAPFGSCFTDGSVEVPASCAELHTSQEFGISFGRPLAPRDRIARCRDLIGEMTGLSDLTAGGRLRTTLVDNGEANGYSSCRLSAVGKHLLTGTLIGVGEGRVPIG